MRVPAGMRPPACSARERPQQTRRKELKFFAAAGRGEGRFGTCMHVAFKIQIRMIEVFRYQTAGGQEPFTEWLQSLRDKQAQAKVRIRLKRIEAGNFGDCEPVGDGVLELREHLGAGYRVYLGRHGQTVVILLCGGSKRSQATDIKTAKDYWADWKRRQT